ncbi:hypothetical protein [Aminobacter sp. HY435]|uniref:hypothetical protein n=1 Tax=Aminobacter sp. HY435 TaxID=2970917 RepID=UPI0022B9BDE4|nr:hypothetical protein [Aminobacter sp. HY435]
MKRATLLICCGLLAACSQTNTATDTSPQLAAAAARPAAKGKAGKAMTAQQRCEEAMQKAAKAQTNAAMLGGALSMVGGFGGFGGSGGAIAASAASVGGSLVQAKAQNDADQAMQTECMG